MKAQPIADWYADYLLASFGATTATGLSQLLEGEVSHDQVSRYLAGTKKTATELWKTVNPLVREVQSAAGVLIIYSFPKSFVANKPASALRQAQGERI